MKDKGPFSVYVYTKVLCNSYNWLYYLQHIGHSRLLCTRMSFRILLFVFLSVWLNLLSCASHCSQIHRLSCWQFCPNGMAWSSQCQAHWLDWAQNLNQLYIDYACAYDSEIDQDYNHQILPQWGCSIHQPFPVPSDNQINQFVRFNNWWSVVE